MVAGGSLMPVPWRILVTELLAGRNDLGDADIWRVSMQAQREIMAVAVGLPPEF